MVKAFNFALSWIEEYVKFADRIRLHISFGKIRGSAPLDIHAYLWMPAVGATDDLPSLFDIIDVDGSGNVEIDEFCSGLLRFMDDASLEMLGMDKRIVTTSLQSRRSDFWRGELARAPRNSVITDQV